MAAGGSSRQRRAVWGELYRLGAGFGALRPRILILIMDRFLDKG